jgi:hypothetical protein
LYVSGIKFVWSHFPDSVVVLVFPGVFPGVDEENSLPLLKEIVELSKTAVLCNCVIVSQSTVAPEQRFDRVLIASS